jgi:flagellar P-ring protein precursor FlgI
MFRVNFRWAIGGTLCGIVATIFLADAAAQTADHKVLIRDVASVEGIRDNSLIGYGLVVGLKGSGDKQQTYFTIQTLASILQRMGVEIPPSVVQSTVQVKNVAAVFVTATLPPFSRPGMPLDVIVSSAGDARSLEGGLLLLTPLYAADGQVYAAAQGPLVVGGYAIGSAANSKQVNHPTVGRIPNGGLIERDSSVDLTKLQHLSLLLNDASFTTVEEVAAVINHELASPSAVVVDSRRVDIQTPVPGNADLPALLARLENLEVRVRRKAKVVVNERTGTVVMGRDVRLGAVSILHGTFSIEVTTTYSASQPSALSGGQTVVLPETRIKASDSPARNVELNEGASVEELVTRLQAIGATARDVVSILQAIKAAGALEAELEVI